MKALSRLALASALLLMIFALPGSITAQTTPTASEMSAAADSAQAQAPDSVQAQPAAETTAATPPAQPTPMAGAETAAGAAGAAGAAATTATPSAAPSTTAPPASAAPSTAPPATAPAAQSAQTPPPAQSSAPAAHREPFTKGTTRVSITGGWGRSFDEDYLMLGVGAGRFIANGLNLGLDFEAWLFGDPGVFKISPNVNYVLRTPRRTKPYVGGFWRRTMIEDADDLSSIGGRAGAYFRGAGPVMIGGGAVYENYLDCDDNLYQNCSQVYPEFLISASF